MYAGGADVIWSIAGLSDVGVADAARDTGGTPGDVWAMATDVDLIEVVAEDVRPFVLMSVIGRVDVVVSDVIAAQVDGTFVGGIDYYDLARNGLDYLPTEGALDDVIPVLETVRQLIIDGSIVVPTAP